MSTFSVNQARQLFIAKGRSTGITSESTIGDIQVVGGTSADPDAYDFLQFVYKSPGGIVPSDIITKKYIRSAVATSYTKFRRGLKKYSVSLTSNSGAVVAGQEYLIGFTFYEVGAPGMENQYYKNTVVFGTPTMTKLGFYETLKEACVRLFKSEAIDYLNFSTNAVAASTTVTNQYTITAKDAGAAGNNINYTLSLTATTAGVTVTTTAGVTTVAIGLTSTDKTVGDLISVVSGNTTAAALIEVAAAGTATATTTVDDAVATAAALTSGSDGEFIIEEVEQPWLRGKKQSRPLRFDVFISTITVSGEEVIWGTATQVQSTTLIGNGKSVCDYEWFAMGERGDQYRGMGYPHNLETTYLADPTVEYHFIDIAYYTPGSGTDTITSEKTITLAVPAPSSAPFTLVNNIITDLTSAGITGLSALS